MKKIFLSLILSSFLLADTIGGEASIGFYHHSLDGSSRYDSREDVDFSDTLDLSSSQDIFLNLYIEHPFPLFPNVKIGYNTLSYEENSRVQALTWGEISNYTGKVSSELSLDYTDITLYYELLDNWTELDLGLTYRSFSGDMSISASNSNDTLNIDKSTPMLYGKARFNVPTSDLSFQLEANYINLAGVNSYDYALSARYSFIMGVGLEAGYKKLYLESDELADDFTATMEFSGPYLLAIWDF